MRNVSLPALSALQDDPAKYANYFVKMLAVLPFIYMPLIVCIGVYAHPIVLQSWVPNGWMPFLSFVY